jgi:hypothetical protein
MAGAGVAGSQIDVMVVAVTLSESERRNDEQLERTSKRKRWRA